jgi:NHL repeat
MKAIYAAAAAALLLAPAIVAAQAPGAERAPAVAAPAPPPPLPPPTNAPEIRVDAVDFLKLPKDMYVGEIAGVAVNKQGHVFVFQRGNTSGPAYGAAAAQLLEFDQAGTFVREIGKNLYAWSYAHAVRVDPEGNIWAADKGSDMVIKFNPAGKVVMVFGRKSEASDENAKPIERVNPPRPAIDGQFRQVTDMTWDSKGNTYISDGYINSRVAKVSKEGQWLKSWGSPGREPGQFNTLHTIASDAQDRIYVGDRGNQRIQVFNTEGDLLKIIRINVPFPPNAPVAIGNQPAPGQGAGTAAPFAPWAICITPPNAAGKQFLFMADSYPGRVYKMDLDGKVIGWFGGNGKQLKQFGWIHEMACPDENTVFAAELLNWRLQKLTLH